MSDPPKKLLYGISGYMERETRPSGIEDILWASFSAVPHLCICRFVWNEKPYSIAKWVRRIVNRWPGIEVNSLSYSYGCTTATQVIDELAGLDIENAWMIDPVWRPNRWATPISIFGWGTLYVGHNVKHCRVWRQKQTIIRGCNVEMRGRNTEYTEDLLNYRHTQIDNSPAIQGTIIERMKA